LIPGAPPPGTLHKQPRLASEWERRIQWARQPTGGWKQGDYCMTPSGRLGRVVSVSDDGIALQYVQEECGTGRRAVDVTLKRHLCRWLSPREVRALRQPNGGVKSEGGADAAA
jgi:hypothetical protein